MLTQEDVTLPNHAAATHEHVSSSQIPVDTDAHNSTFDEQHSVIVGSALVCDIESPGSLDSGDKASDLQVAAATTTTTRAPQTLSLRVGADEDFGGRDEYIVDNGSPAASTWSKKNHSSKSKKTVYDSSRLSDVSLSLFPWNNNSPNSGSLGRGLCDGSGDGEATDNQSLLPMSPRKQRMQEREAAYQRFYFVISSPVPYLIFVILLAMIVMIFVDVIAISGLVCITAVLMVSVFMNE